MHTDVRQATRADAATLQRFLEALAIAIGKSGAIKGRAANLERFGFGAHPFFTALIASQGGHDHGLLLYFFEYSSWRGNPGLYVQDLYVSDAARGTGVAQALLARAALDCRQAGGSYLRLSASADNVAAHCYYLKTGFRAVDDEQLFLLEGPAFESLLHNPGGIG